MKISLKKPPLNIRARDLVLSIMGLSILGYLLVLAAATTFSSLGLPQLDGIALNDENRATSVLILVLGFALLRMREKRLVSNEFDKYLVEQNTLLKDSLPEIVKEHLKNSYQIEDDAVKDIQTKYEIKLKGFVAVMSEATVKLNDGRVLEIKFAKDFAEKS